MRKQKKIIGVLSTALGIMTAIVAWQFWTLYQRGNHNSEIVAHVADQTLTLHDLEQGHRDAFQKRKDLFFLQSKKINDWMKDTVLNLEAQRRGIPINDLIEEELKATPLEITDQEVQALVKRFGKIYPDPEHPDQKTTVPKAEARRYLEHVQRERVSQRLADKLLASTSHAITLEEPKGPQITEDLAIPNRPSWGSPTANAKIVVFSDFECPFCQQLALDVLKKIQLEFGDRIFVVYRDLPIAHHKYAYQAAIAAKCAARQGKFWPYHDQVFQNQNALDRENLIALAARVDMDLAAFKNCLLDKTIEAQVEEDISVAARYGFRATPTLIINGEVSEGVISYDILREKIQSQIK